MKTKELIIIGRDYTDTSQVPKDKNIFYRCTNCAEIIPSLPKDKIANCKCGNLHIDLFYWRLHVKDLHKLEVLEKA